LKTYIFKVIFLFGHSLLSVYQGWRSTEFQDLHLAISKSWFGPLRLVSR